MTGPGSNGGGRRPRVPRVAEVLRTERLTPHMIRVVLGGEGLAGFPAGEFTDHYVKLLFPPDSPDPERPMTRTYTVRAWDAATGELTLDFVWHGDEGLAGPWAAAAQPGDRISFFGPGGGYAPSPDADWHLLAGDESALPAIGAALERVPAGVPVHALIEVDGRADEQPLTSPGRLDLRWCHRDAARPEQLVDALAGLTFPAGRVHAFVHGEANFVKDVRSFLRKERGIPLDQLSISGYWRRGLNEDGWQSSKRDWNQQIEREQEALSAADQR
jgi:NADPH-dependent ferric siderophore reductase